MIDASSIVENVNFSFTSHKFTQSFIQFGNDSITQVPTKLVTSGRTQTFLWPLVDAYWLEGEQLGDGVDAPWPIAAYPVII